MDQYPDRKNRSARRLELQAKLTKLAPKAWYQKPPANQMTYPCFVYKAIQPKVVYANNHGYLTIPGYEVLYISQTEEDGIWQKMLEEFCYCSPGTKYVSDQLYHYPFTIYY